MQPIIFSVENNIAIVTFNRPKALNALNSSLLREFTRILEKIADDESIRV